MDEPMDEARETVSTQPKHTKKLQVNPLLRAGNMVSMTLTVEEYETQYWPKLKEAINQLLTMTPGQHILIIYEQMYSYVYKCVCKQFSERLFQDILTHMTNHLSCISNELHSLNKFYVETKLKTDLNKELQKLFRATIVDTHAVLLLSLLEEVIAKPFTVSPCTMLSLVHNLHSLNPVTSDPVQDVCEIPCKLADLGNACWTYARVNSHLFSKYIPNVLPLTRVSDLDKYIKETRLMQQQIQNLPGFEVQQMDLTTIGYGEDLLLNNGSLLNSD